MTEKNRMLPMPVICECGYSTMDATEAYRHAMKHQREEEDRRIAENMKSYWGNLQNLNE